MQEITKANPLDPQDVGLGAWIGRRQAYSLVAGTCSAADARCLSELRETKAYKRTGLSWEGFCKQHIGMHRSNVDQIIRQYREFGPAYFTLHQITGISAEEYRAIRGAIEDGSLRHAGDAIPIAAEHAPRLLEAVRELRAPLPAKARAATATEPPSPCGVAVKALQEAEAAIGGLESDRLSDDDYRRLCALATRLAFQMKRISIHLVPVVAR
ncbi:MAG TPA: hypothetical protein VKX45_01770 [Bryobacteraceae bacterium]|jgi:hypothetical protein|nr:hypothetical protein [Bryobacteraceae bacterium]